MPVGDFSPPFTSWEKYSIAHHFTWLGVVMGGTSVPDNLIMWLSGADTA